MSDYTPTTDEVRAVWREWNGYGGLINRVGPEPTTRAEMEVEFNRWLAAHDREVREQVAQEIEATPFAAENRALYPARYYARIARGEQA